MITKMSLAGTSFFAVAITWDRIGLPPISCRTLGCFDLSRVPLPAAMMAIAIRAGPGFDLEGFDARSFPMLSQYTANHAATYVAGARLERHGKPGLGDVGCGMVRGI